MSSGVIKYDLSAKRLVGSIKLWLLFICLFFFFSLINVVWGSHGAAHSVALFQHGRGKTGGWKYFKYYISQMRRTEDQQGATFGLWSVSTKGGLISALRVPQGGDSPQRGGARHFAKMHPFIPDLHHFPLVVDSSTERKKKNDDGW